MAYNNKQKLADRQAASHPQDIGKLLMQGDLGKHAGSGTDDIGSAMLQGTGKAAILKEPGTSINQLLGQGGGVRGKSRKGKS